MEPDFCHEKNFVIKFLLCELGMLPDLYEFLFTCVTHKRESCG